MQFIKSKVEFLFEHGCSERSSMSHLPQFGNENDLVT